MNRTRIVTIGGAVLAGLILAVFAYLLVDAQNQEQDEVEQRFEDVADVSAAVTDGIFQASLSGAQEQAAARFSGAVSDEAVEAFARRGNNVYAAVLDDDGQRLAATEDAPRAGDAVDVAIESGQARLSDVMGSGEDAVVEWAIPFPTESGQRILVQGIPLAAFAEFLEASLGGLPTFAGARTEMVDGDGTVMGGTRLTTPVGSRVQDEGLLAALEDGSSGEYDGSYFATGPISGSPFRIVLATTKDDLYESISGRTVTWLIFGAFALALIAGLFLLRRASIAAAELERKRLNERHAVEINDNIIQGLALAKYQLQAGQGEQSADQVSETLREAQRLVSGLLGDAEVQAGQLRREMAAETSRPGPPPAEEETAQEPNR